MPKPDPKQPTMACWFVAIFWRDPISEGNELVAQFITNTPPPEDGLAQSTPRFKGVLQLALEAQAPNFIEDHAWADMMSDMRGFEGDFLLKYLEITDKTPVMLVPASMAAKSHVRVREAGHIMPLSMFTLKP